MAVKTAQLINNSSQEQEVSQTVTFSTTTSTTTSIEETEEISLEMSVTASYNAVLASASATLTVGYSNSRTVVTEQTEEQSKEESFTFNAKVAPESKLKATCLIKMGTYNVPWTAKARITYRHGTSEVKTISGELQGVAVSEIFAQYDEM